MRLSPKATAQAKARARTFRSSAKANPATSSAVVAQAGRKQAKERQPSERQTATAKTSGGSSPAFGSIQGSMTFATTEVDASVLTRAVSEMRAIQALGVAMAASPEPVSPE